VLVIQETLAYQLINISYCVTNT